MKNKPAPSPTRSLGVARTPKRKHRRSFSVGSAKSNASGRLTAIIQQHRSMNSFVLSPLARRSILSDNTEIEEPRRKSWWKKLNENSRDVIEVIQDNNIVEPNNIMEELDIDVLSQEKRNYTMELPESSDSESIHSIIIPRREIFLQKENQPQKKFGELIGNRETLTRLHKTANAEIATANADTRELFQNKQCSKPIFPAALLNISLNKTTADKTNEFATVQPKAQMRNIFGNRAATKRKNIFSNFIASESEDEIPEIQPKVFAFHKKSETRRRGSSSSQCFREPSPSSSMATDIEMDDWKMLPSSTMVDNQLEIMMSIGQSPKIARLSKLSEDKESETATSSRTAISNDISKCRKSKTYTKEKMPELEKTRRSKTFTKQISPEVDKSHKSKTFVKDKPDIEWNTSNKSNISQDVGNRDLSSRNISDKSNYKNLSHSIIRTRNQSKRSSNSSPAIEEEPINNSIKQALNKSGRKIIAFSPRQTNKSYGHSKVTADQDTDDDGLNISLKYDDEDNEQDIQIDESVEGVKSKKKRNKSTSNESNLSIKSQEVELSAKLKPIQEKTNLSLRPIPNNKSQCKDTVEDNMEIDEGIDQLDNAAKAFDRPNEDVEIEHGADENKKEDNISDKVENNEKNESVMEKSDVQHDISQELENKNIRSVLENEKQQNRSGELENLVENKQNESYVENAIEDEKNESEVKDVSQEVEKDDEDEQYENQIEDKVQNDQEADNENEINVIQAEDEELNESLEVENEDKQNESQVENEEHNESLENEDDQNVSQVESENKDDQNESQVESENEDDQNESQVVSENEDVQNESQIESENEDDQNESQVESENEDDQNESQVESENEDDQNESQIESENEDDQNESQIENEDQNVSQEVESEEDDEQNESQIKNSDIHSQSDEEHNENQEISNDVVQISQVVENENEEDGDQNISQEEMEQENDRERNYSKNIEQDSEAIDDSDIYNEPADHDADTQEIEPEQVESPNVSHDTTGRNRKKHETAEVVLRGTTHLDSSGVKRRNSSIRKTISPNIRSTFEPKEITRLSDGTKNSSAEGSGWDSHRTTRKTLRQTFGNDYTTRKSLRALVMEKSAKRHTTYEGSKFQANSTELPDMSNRLDNDVQDENLVSNHEVSLRTRHSTLDTYLQKIRENNAEKRHQTEERVRNSLFAPKQHIFKVPAKPPVRRAAMAQQKPKPNTFFLADLPEEVMEDLKYKPPKRFQPSNAPWITKRLYKYLETKLENRYDYKARVRAEKLVEHIYHFAKELRRLEVASTDAVDVLKREMARLNIVKTHFDFYEFFHKFLPREIRIKVIPDIVNKIPMPRNGVFAEIL